MLSLFSGIGAFEKALANIKADYNLTGFSEIDKHAIEAYCVLHNVDKNLNLGDVSKINKSSVNDFDLLVGGSPCQAFSVAGARKGFEDTRGTLFFEFVDMLKNKKPKYFLYENVKGVINHDKGNTLNVMAEAFSQVGYIIDMNLLNSKFFDVPQHRERIYIVGVRDDLIKQEEWIIKKGTNVLSKGKKRLQDLKIKTFNFKWPTEDIVTKRLRDILEGNVDEKYYIDEVKAQKILKALYEQQSVPEIIRYQIPQKVKVRKYDVDVEKLKKLLRQSKKNSQFSNKQIAAKFQKPITEVEHWFRTDDCFSIPDANVWFELKKLLNISTDEFDLPVTEFVEKDGVFEKSERCYDVRGVSPTLTRTSADEKIIEPQMLGMLDIKGNECIRRVYSSEGVSPTLTTMEGGNRQPKVLEEVRDVLTPDREERRFKENDEPAFTVNTVDKHGVAIGNYPTYRVRKLTPLECWRLQAFSDSDFIKARNKLNEVFHKGKDKSDSQMYKLAGNSITVTVLEEIFKNLLYK